MKNWYGLRRLYEPRFRERLVVAVLFALAGYYVLWSATQWLTLDAAALRFDFVNYFGGAVAAAHGENVYAEFKRSWGSEAWVVAYIYPPFFALALAPLTALGLVTAGRVWLLVIHATTMLSLRLILRVNPEVPPSGRRVFLVAAFGFMPLYLNLKFQQVASVWLLLLTATLWAALRRRDVAAGLFLALAASLKVGPVFLVPLFARLERWRAAITGAGLLVLITAATMLASPGSFEFFTVVLPRIGLGTSNWDNGSVDGLVSRFVDFFPNSFGPYTSLVAKAVIVLAVVVILGFTLSRAAPRSADGWNLRLSLAAMITALLMVSSVTWQHHMVTLLLPIGVAMAWLYARRPGSLYAWWLVLGYALCWIDRRAFPLPQDHVVHSTGQALLVLAATSVKLAGLAVLWTLFLRMQRLEARRALRQPVATPRPAAPPAA